MRFIKGEAMPKRRVPRAFNLHGGGIIAEEASVKTPFHEPTIQLLVFDDGSRSLRFCTYHGRSFGRMPLIVSEEHLRALAEEVKKRPEIRELLRMLVA